MGLYTYLMLCSSVTGKNTHFQTMQTQGMFFGKKIKLLLPLTSCNLLVPQKCLRLMFHLQALNGTET